MARVVARVARANIEGLPAISAAAVVMAGGAATPRSITAAAFSERISVAITVQVPAWLAAQVWARSEISALASAAIAAQALAAIPAPIAYGRSA